MLVKMLELQTVQMRGSGSKLFRGEENFVDRVQGDLQRLLINNSHMLSSVQEQMTGPDYSAIGTTETVDELGELL